MFKRILFADDGSGRIEGAFSAATALAAREHAQLILVHVSPEDAPAQGEMEVSANLRSRVEALRAAGLSAESHMKFGNPAEKLADAALASNADLLVISPQHHSILQSLRHPSVTARIIGQATVPVLIWPQQLPGTAFDDLLTKPTAEVIVPLDGSKEAERALPMAQTLARAYGQLLLLVRAISPAPIVGTGIPYPIEIHTQEDDARDARHYLHDLRRRIATTTELTVESMVLSGDPATELAHLAAEHHGSLLVMTTHGRGRVARFLLGSVATELLRQAETPLVIIPPLHTASAQPQPAETDTPNPESTF